MCCTQDDLSDGAISHYKQTPSIVIKRYGRKVAFNTYHLLPGDNFETAITTVVLRKLHIIIHATPRSNLVLPVAGCFGANVALN
jgi:hypothetical protein